MWESNEPRGTALPLHVHTREDEQIVVLAGRVTFVVGDRVHHLGPGDTLALPRGVAHAHLVTSATARVLTIVIPGGFEQLFLEMGVPVESEQQQRLPDRESLARAAERFGVEIVGPPPALDTV